MYKSFESTYLDDLLNLAMLHPSQAINPIQSQRFINWVFLDRGLQINSSCWIAKQNKTKTNKKKEEHKNNNKALMLKSHAVFLRNPTLSPVLLFHENKFFRHHKANYLLKQEEQRLKSYQTVEGKHVLTVYFWR